MYFIDSVPAESPLRDSVVNKMLSFCYDKMRSMALLDVATSLTYLMEIDP